MLPESAVVPKLPTMYIGKVVKTVVLFYGEEPPFLRPLSHHDGSKGTMVTGAE